MNINSHTTSIKTLYKQANDQKQVNKTAFKASINKDTFVSSKKAEQKTVSFNGLFYNPVKKAEKANTEFKSALKELKNSKFDSKEALVKTVQTLHQNYTSEKLMPHEYHDAKKKLAQMATKEAIKNPTSTRAEAVVAFDGISDLIIKRVASSYPEKSDKLFDTLLSIEDKGIQKDLKNQIRLALFNILSYKSYSPDTTANTFKLTEKYRLIENTYQINLIRKQVNNNKFETSLAAIDYLPSAINQLIEDKKESLDRKDLKETLHDVIDTLFKAGFIAIGQGRIVAQHTDKALTQIIKSKVIPEDIIKELKHEFPLLEIAY